MKALLTPVSVVLVLIAVVLAMLGHLPLAGICAVAWVGSLALNSMRSSTYERLSDPVEVLDPDSRALFLPVRRLVAEIQDKVANYPDVPMIKAMGPEVIREALRIQEQVAPSGNGVANLTHKNGRVDDGNRASFLRKRHRAPAARAGSV